MSALHYLIVLSDILFLFLSATSSTRSWQPPSLQSSQKVSEESCEHRLTEIQRVGEVVVTDFLIYNLLKNDHFSPSPIYRLFVKLHI